jgi:chromatin assembly factor 1 subunit B
MESQRYVFTIVGNNMEGAYNFAIGETLASAGDDGNVLLWVLAEHQLRNHFGDDGLEDKETWRVKHMCRSFGSEIYDLAWSPDGVFFICGSMDNVARIYNAQTGEFMLRPGSH